MNNIDSAIQNARKRRFLHYFLGGVLLLIAAISYVIWLFFTQGYALKVLPEKAEANHFASLSSGSGFYLGGALYLIGDRATLEVGSPNFFNETVNIDENTTKILRVTLKPRPSRLVATIQPAEPATRWLIDNKPVHVGSAFDQDVSPGEHGIIIDHAGYETIEERFSLEANQVLNKTWVLQPIIGQLRIDTTPSGADIYINGALAGSTPLSLEKPVGQYAIKMVADGYQSITDTLAITKQERDIARNYSLAERPGKLFVRITPSGGQLTIDGKSTQPNEQGIDVKPNHKLAVKYAKSGYLSYQANVEVKPGESKTLEMALTEAFGEVEIMTTPAATIAINGKPQGQGTLTTSLRVAEQQLAFSLAGYETQTLTITPSSKQTTLVNITLLKSAEAKRLPAQPAYAATLGIDLLAVKPSRFVMGSPPNQKGRKRNEFQVPVNFSRGIWVSRHEITEAQYAAFDPSSASSALPVSNISWLDAAKFCNWLSEKEGLTPFYQFNNGQLSGFNAQSSGYRLPTEAEWEWLAKKAKRSVSTVYVWGNTERIPNRAGNFADTTAKGSVTFHFKNYNDGYATKSPVGSFKIDRLGLYDLAGNVSEWVNDHYTNNPPDTSVTVTDYMGASRGSGYLYKGGNYRSGRLADLRGAFRETEKTRDPTIGFRVVRYQ
ncbi:SUMF1/EgtB/PvdO family nonheme iron enzyme [Gammaproteobacteria bacterium]|nr:SUMF1/EgtB/PvdO family nonheme iron enzyme [Gammaproteobacteria bacterium]